MLSLLFIFADLSTTLGNILDCLGFLSDHWQAIGGILAAAVLLLQQWRTASAAKAAAKAAAAAVAVAAKADDGAKLRDAKKFELLKENTDATLDTQERTKVIERMTNGERAACIAHVEAMEDHMRAAGLPVPPKPPILA